VMLQLLLQTKSSRVRPKRAHDESCLRLRLVSVFLSDTSATITKSVFSVKEVMAWHYAMLLIEIDRCKKSLLEDSTQQHSKSPPQTSYCCLTQTYAILRDTDRRLIPLYLSSAYCCKGKSTCIHQPETSSRQKKSIQNPNKTSSTHQLNLS
jgi:hypothetical protein